MISDAIGSLRLWAVALTVAGCGSCASAPAQQPPQEKQLTSAISPPIRTTPPAYIPDAARAMLRMRMVSHAKDMGDLMSAVVRLRYADAETLADEIVDDASLARPIGIDATELNNLLPPRFFELQDQVRNDARVMAEAAHRQSALDLGKAYGRVAERCVACHALFRPTAEQAAR